MTLAFKARVNDENIASYRYRVLTPIAFLSARGHSVELFDQTNFDRYETVVFSKAYSDADRKLARQLKAAGKRVLLDLCDDHFYNPHGLAKYRKTKKLLREMISVCDGVVCSTPKLARTVERKGAARRPPEVAPDVYEQAEVQVGPPTPPDQPARLLWFGRHGSPNAPAGMADLLLIRDQLAQAFALRPFELVVSSDSPQRYDELFADFPVPTRYAPWSRESFAVELARADAVLIPLSQNPFVAAKTHNRLSLALSAGVPVVSDPLDSYRPFAEFAYIDNWAGGLEAVLLRPEEARARAAAALPYLKANWSAEAVAPAWEAALGLRVGGRRTRVVSEPLRPVPHVMDWLAGQGRARRRWLIACEDANPRVLARARAHGEMVMTAAPSLQADVMLAIDAELLKACGGDLGAAFLLVPSDLHSGGWASGRSLASWGADLPLLRRMRAQGRLLRFDLWTGSPDGLEADLEADDIAGRLLAAAGVTAVERLGVRSRASASTGFDGLTSVLERRWARVTP